MIIDLRLIWKVVIELNHKIFKLEIIKYQSIFMQTFQKCQYLDSKSVYAYLW